MPRSQTELLFHEILHLKEPLTRRPFFHSDTKKEKMLEKRKFFWRNGNVEGITTLKEVLADYHSLNQLFQQ